MVKRISNLRKQLDKVQVVIPILQILQEHRVLIMFKLEIHKSQEELERQMLSVMLDGLVMYKGHKIDIQYMIQMMLPELLLKKLIFMITEPERLIEV